VPDPQQPPAATVGPVEPAPITATQDHAQRLADDPRPGHPASLDPTEVVAVTDILPAAISAAADLAVEGRPVSRETLSEKLREQGHAISTARASTLVKIVKALPTGTDPDSDAITVAEGTARPARPQARSRRATSQTDASRAETHPAAVLSGEN
jgi:hypothetical protein